MWDATLAEAAEPLIASRAEAVAELTAPFAAAAAELGLEAATIEYAPRAAGSAAELREGWRSAARPTCGWGAAPGGPTSTS